MRTERCRLHLRRLPGRVGAERHRRRECGQPPGPLLVVEGGQLLEQDVQRDAVADDVRDGQDDPEVAGAEAQQVGAQRRSLREIEAVVVLTLEPGGEGGRGIGLAAEIVAMQRQPEGRQHVLMVCAGREYRAQRLVAPDEAVQRQFERVRVHLAGYRRRQVDVVGEQPVLGDLAEEQELALRLGQRVAQPRRRDRVQEAGVAHGDDARLGRLDDRLDVGGAVRVRQEAVAALPDVDAALDHVEEEQVDASARHEAEQRGEVHDLHRDAFGREEGVERGGEIGRAAVEAGVERGTEAPDLLPGRARGRHGPRVLVEGAGVEPARRRRRRGRPPAPRSSAAPPGRHSRG